MTQEPVAVSNTYDGPALFATGPNPFNVHGYFYFVKRVLPRVGPRVDGFRLQVTGYASQRVVGAAGVELAGFVPELGPLYRRSRFAVSPVAGGTGQQVKIVEAMAHGVPVVALRPAAANSPIQHEVNGLVANDAGEFAEHVVRLWRSPALCRRLGEAARQTIADSFSRRHFTERLASVLAARRNAEPLPVAQP